MSNLEDVLLRGLRSAQPLATAVGDGTLYFVTDEGVIEQSNGAAWVSYSDTADSGITQLTGDVTAGPGSGSVAATIGANKVLTANILAKNVTYAKIQDVSASPRLLGRATAAAGVVEEITLGTNLSVTGTTLNAASGNSGITELTGDVTAGPGSGAQAASIGANKVVTAKILDANVTYAKIQDVSAASKLLGRGSAGGSGDVEEITLGTNLSMSGTTINASGGSGGNITSTGAVGSEPGSPASGDLYLPNNGVNIERYSGAAWIPWGPIFPVTPPIDANYAWINQGGASVVANAGSVFLLAPAGSGINWRIRKKAAPATPYTITGMFLITGLFPDFHQMGLLFRNASSGKLALFTLQGNDGGVLTGSKCSLNSLTYASPTSFNALYKASNFWPGKVVFMRIADNGVNRICSLSPDGQNWIVFHTIVRTDYFTADEVGFAVNSEQSGATDDASMTLISWKEA